jgi:hypothetical protein
VGKEIPTLPQIMPASLLAGDFLRNLQQMSKHLVYDVATPVVEGREEKKIRFVV